MTTTPPLSAPLDVVRAHPLCAETPVPVLQHAVTPRESVYVRSNFDTPVAHSAWTLRVEGAVQEAYTITLDELQRMPQHTVLVTMECAGNWRLGMTPVPEGEPWKYGAVSTTRWRGVPLSVLLARAGVAADAIEVLAVGADAGPRSDAEGIIRFERAIPLDVAMHPDTLLATHMDDEPLTPEHGAPLRVIVPGWYGMASVKWLAALAVRTTPFTGYFQTQRYVYHTDRGTTPVSRALVKSMIVSPSPDGVCGEQAEIRGWAWSGYGAITRVDVAVNGAWHEATLGVAASAYAWTPFTVRAALPLGAVELRSRATDASGATQPEAIEWNSLGYGNNAVRTVTVQVVPAVEAPAITIRRGTALDAAMLAEFGRRTFHDTFAADNDPADMAAYLAAAFSPEKQATELAEAHCTCLLAECDGVLAGMAYVIDHSASDAVAGAHLVELQRFYVDTPWHGRGVAAALMRAVVDTATTLGGDALWLGVWERNARAIAFYRKQGFERVGAKTFRLGADVQTDDVMRRALLQP